MKYEPNLNKTKKNMVNQKKVIPVDLFKRQFFLQYADFLSAIDIQNLKYYYKQGT